MRLSSPWPVSAPATGMAARTWLVKTPAMAAAMLLYCFILLLASPAHAQERLTLDQAVDKALASSFDIRIARSVQEIAEANNTAGAAGAYPTLGVAASVAVGTLNTTQRFSSGDQQQRRGAQSISYSVGPVLSWAVFQGGQVRLVRKQLGLQEDIARVQVESQIQATVAAVVREYAGIVFQYQQQIAVDTALSLARVRMFISGARFEAALSSKTDYLQARTDYAARQSDSLARYSALATGFANLNLLMGEPDIDKTWQVDDTLITDQALRPYDSTLLRNTPVIRLAEQNVALAQLNQRVARAQLYPGVTLNTGYTYSRVQNQAGFLLFNQSIGPSVGLGVTVPLFDGGNLRRQVRVAGLQALQEEIRLGRTNSDLARRYRSAWTGYEIALAALRLEQENIQYAQENLDIQRARFRVGIGNTLEVREAENSYVQALLRRYTAGYNLKIAETGVIEVEAGFR